jgi:nuclear GTP-binding protein
MPKTSSKTGPPRRFGIKKGGHSMNPDRPVSELKGVGSARSRATINRLQMYRNFKAKRNRKGKIIQAAPFQVNILRCY